MSKKFTLGIDCGGTNLKIALVDVSGKIHRLQQDSINFKDAPEKVIEGIARRIKKFVQGAAAKEISGIGMGIAGDIDQPNGAVRYSPNLGWKNVPLKKILSEKLTFPILIDNDANCAAWGAYCLDAKRDCENLLCVTLGTGIGGGIILKKKIYRGVSGTAGELGHTTVDFRGRACRCGSFGCLESIVGAWGLVQTVEEGLKKGLCPNLKKNLERTSKKVLTPELIAKAAREGDSFCRQTWNEAGEVLGAALANFVNLLNPDRIVFCGGVSKAGDLILPPTLHSLGRRAFQSAVSAVKVTLSQFDEKLGVAGAGLLFWE